MKDLLGFFLRWSLFFFVRMGPCERVPGDVSSPVLVNVSSHCTREAGYETRSDVAASIDGPFSSTDYLGSFELHRSNGFPPPRERFSREMFVYTWFQSGALSAFFL